MDRSGVISYTTNQRTGHTAQLNRTKGVCDCGVETPISAEY